MHLWRVWIVQIIYFCSVPANVKHYAGTRRYVYRFIICFLWIAASYTIWTIITKDKNATIWFSTVSGLIAPSAKRNTWHNTTTQYRALYHKKWTPRFEKHRTRKIGREYHNNNRKQLTVFVCGTCPDKPGLCSRKCLIISINRLTFICIWSECTYFCFLFLIISIIFNLIFNDLKHLIWSRSVAVSNSYHQGHWTCLLTVGVLNLSHQTWWFNFI